MPAEPSTRISELITRASGPSTRASDADRDQSASLLRDNLVAGRLSVDEFHERLEKALTAKTLGQLADLRSDLPAIDLGAPGPDPQAVSRLASGQVEAVRGRLSPSWRAAWGSWLTISLLAFVVWLIGGAGGSLWFLWVTLPLGALLLGGWVTGAPASRDRRRDRRG